MTTKKPISILREVFGMLPGQRVTEFKKECDELKSHGNYKQFIEECAKQLGCKADFS